ncbi:patr class I histocompatibility antigen, A-5 alpha chain-like [Alosa pseudoharengus]|uniref:patr class I histocompatibility antigen, A-5 alpha chain-like n=1 Tax=Alosa pseudoharengus TaxID=34774 RepID=UPI003F8CC293
MKLTVLALLLGVYCVHQISGVIHSWKSYWTATTGLSEFPEFVALNILDNEIMGYFDSKAKRFESKQGWMVGAPWQDYEERETNLLMYNAQVYKERVNTAMQRTNQTQGVHTFQKMYGYQWDDESGATDGFMHYGYDGEDWMSLDLKNRRYIAIKPQSVLSKLNRENTPGHFEMKQSYFYRRIKWGKEYVQYRNSILERKVRPEVTLFQAGSGVVCHSTGFYPEAVMIIWKRDGEEREEDVYVGETLPNEDGTFQKRAVLTVSPEERKKGQYTCEVAHKSGPPIVMTLTVEDGNTLGIIIGCVIAALVVIGVIVGIVMMKNKGYKKAEQSDSESEPPIPLHG